jgi:hypothetical protein
MPLPGQQLPTPSGPCLVPPATLVDAVRARITPLFPGWERERIEALVAQMASLEWRYLVGTESPAALSGLVRTSPSPRSPEDST